jgi:pimeloyl-ACP methyl ester carboxylesterase
MSSCGKEESADGDTASDGTSEQLSNGWVTIQRSSGTSDSAYYNHPTPGTAKPAVIYNHGKFIEQNGFSGGVSAGYDITDFADAIANSGFAGIAPVRASGSTFDDGMFDAVISALKAQDDIDGSQIFMYGFSRGGLLSHQFAVNDDSQLKGVILNSPSPGRDVGSSSNEFAETLDDLQAIDVPYLVLIGDEEDNPTITSNVNQLVTNLNALNKSLAIYRLTGDSDDPTADHDWFYVIRTAYWTKIDSFLSANS